MCNASFENDVCRATAAIVGFTSQGEFLDWAPSLLAQAGPFAFLAGIGLVCTGVVLDEVQKWDVFVKYSVLFILIPALLGLKVCALNRSVNPLRDSLYHKKPQLHLAVMVHAGCKPVLISLFLRAGQP
jgi:hypothetical protein